MACFCLILGWIVTSSIGATESSFDLGDQDDYDVASSGILDDPSGFSVPPPKKERPGIVDEEAEERKKNSTLSDPLGDSDEEPSVAGALSQLHNAVSGKIKKLSPYVLKSSLTHPDGKAANKAKSAIDPNSTWLGESVHDGSTDDDRLGARVRIAKCTILFNPNGIWERALRTHEAHNKQHGYRMHTLRESLVDDVWSKPAYILSILLRELAKPPSERLDWLFWVDADTIILNPYVPIDTFLPPQGTEFDDINLLFSNDWNGLNNGVFPVRVNQWSVNFFAAIVAYRHYRPEDELTFRDQSAMNNLMQAPQFRKQVLQAPQRWFNAYQGEHNETLQPFSVRRGDLLVHFAGVIPREERMQHWLDRAEQHLDDWEMPVKSTSYPQEARDFWSDQRGNRRAEAETLRLTHESATKLMEKVNQKLDDYGDRLTEEQKASITSLRDSLRTSLENPVLSTDTVKLEEVIKALSEGITALTEATTEANKSLLKTAHTTIFAAEKLLLDFGGPEGEQQHPALTQDLETLRTRINSLKTLIMVPEESWSKIEISTATNGLTEVTAQIQEKLDAEIAATRQAAAIQAAAIKAEEDKRKAELARDAAAAAELRAVGSGIMEGEVGGEKKGGGLLPEFGKGANQGWTG